MNDSKGFLHPETLAKIQRLEMRARKVVEGFLNGTHRSPYFGQSVEFAQHRPYVSGDDLRHVDWKVWARQDRLYVKQFEEETDLRCTVALDISPSMAYGRGALTKLQYAATVAASLSWLILKQQDAVGLVTFEQRFSQHLPQRSSQIHLAELLEVLQSEVDRIENAPALDAASQGGSVPETMAVEQADIEPIFLKLAGAFPRRGLFVIISDLLVDLDSFGRGIRGLAAAGHEILLLHVMDDDELDFPFEGPSRFEAFESNFWMKCNPKDLRDGYLAAVEEHLDQIRTITSRYAVDYRLVRTSESLAGVLTAFLNRRSLRLGR